MTISKRKAQTSYWIHLASRWITQALTSQNKLNKDWTTLVDQVELSMVHLDQTKIACIQMLSAINRSRWLDLRRTHRFSQQKVASHPINLASLLQMSILKTRAKTNKSSLIPLLELPLRCIPTSQVRYHPRIYQPQIYRAIQATHLRRIRSTLWARCSR